MNQDESFSNKVNSAAMWKDPDSHISSGILLSDRIKFYVDAVQLVEPFYENNLCPASYDLTLGSECSSAEHTEETGQSKRTLKPGENLIIPPNSIVFVSSAETLNLPFYLTARFNLKLRLLHEGLLVGTGPQIDPGYLGRLSCPLHNISSGKISLTCGESFAVIEFQKTTPFAQSKQWTEETNIEQIRRMGEAKELQGINKFPCVTFKSRSLNRKPIKGYLPVGKYVSSSVQGIADELANLREESKNRLDDFEKHIKTLNYGLFITVLVLAISFSGYFFATINSNKSVYENALKVGEQQTQLKKEIENIQNKIVELRSRVMSTNLPDVYAEAPTNAVSAPKPPLQTVTNVLGVKDTNAGAAPAKMK